ncbi:precorrin-3B C(17)-methyltransferase [Caldiplasma sukawensis]
MYEFTWGDVTTSGKIYIVGIGPGSREFLSPAAVKAISESQVIVGFTLYVELIRDLISHKKVVSNGMTGELARARYAVKEADEGNVVSLVSSGDPGIYGIGAALFEIVESINEDIDIEIIPGISALSSVASLVGVPLANDFAVISMSDMLTPHDVIMKRMECLMIADLVTVIYNPRGSRFPDNLSEAFSIVKKYRDGKTPVAHVRNAYRKGMKIEIETVETYDPNTADMITTVIIGNSNTRMVRGKMATPRGYTNKYGGQ